MQQYKILSIYGLILFISFGCQQASKKQTETVLSNVKSTKTTANIYKAEPTNKAPAVIYKSADLGTTWSSFDQGIPTAATLSSIQQAGNKLYVSTDYHGIFVSTAGENNWTALNQKFLKELDINCLEVDENNLVIGTLREGIFYSTDGGLNWKRAKVPINSPIRSFIRADDRLLAGTDSGIYESSDGGNTWSHSFGQYQILGFTSLNGQIYAATQHGAIMNDGISKNWSTIYEGDALHDVGNDGQYIYAMTIGQQLLKTKNDGQLWENAQNGITYPTNFYTNELQHINQHIFSAQWIGIYHSIDNGNNWQMLSGLPDSTAFSTLAITDFGVIAGISIR